MTSTGDPQLDRYLEVFEQRIRGRRLGDVEAEGAVAPLAPREAAFTDVVLETLEDLGQVPGLEVAYLEKRIGRANAKANAYGVAEEDGRLDIVVTVARQSEESLNVPAGEIESAVRKAVHVFRAAESPIYEEMEPSSGAYDLMERIYAVRDSLASIRVIVLVDGFARRAPEGISFADVPEVQIDVWDLERLYRADSSGVSYESVEIDLVHHLGTPLPCIAAEPTEDDHRCFLAILPGDLLHDLYHQWGPRLLELNVRSFLQARGKVNRGIRDTILNDPGHFLAFNNGISATVEELKLSTDVAGHTAIERIKGLQIVNGGQTVASIHRARNRDRADLSRVFVQAKITVVGPESINSLVPFISRYSNTQNKVNETDFSANHPFHVRLQQLSEQIWAPGEVSRWFYERARGQWEVARAREGTTPARLRAFDQRVPRKQKADKTLVAKAVNAWNELPHIVSLGGQKNFVRFMSALADKGLEWEPDEAYYRQVIAKILVLKEAERVARRIGFSAYRANSVAYTVALLAYRTAGRVDLEQIWANQSVSEAISQTMFEWMPIVHREIVESAEGRNVTEWCKKKDCWTRIQSLKLDFAPGLTGELAEGLPLPNVGGFRGGNGEKPRDLTSDERDRQAATMRYGADEWLKILEWAHECGEFSAYELNVAGTVLSYAAGGWRRVPSPKQTKHTDRIVSLWEARGALGGEADEPR